jgi:beta-N-acetylhexosaminidase
VAFPPFRSAIAEGVAAVMAGHLVVPAVDDLPATLSHRWLTGILRGAMGFHGVVVTDALEMAAIAGTHGIGAGAVRALSAGADLLCLGGEDAGEQMLDQVAGAIVAAVLDGSLELARLQDAAVRVRSLAEPTTRQQRPVDADAGNRAATAALSISGALPPLVSPVLVLRCDADQSLAVGRVPWGLAAASAATNPPAPADPVLREIGLRSGDPLPQPEIDAAATIVVLTRDRHRHRWMDEVVADVRARRRSAVVVEMGNGELDGVPEPAMASFGASAANGRAVLSALSLVADRSQS